MKILLSFFLSCLMRPAFAQTAVPEPGQLNRKTFSVGYTVIGIRAKALNEALTSYGYPAIDPIAQTVGVSVSSDFGERWGWYYSMDFGGGDNKNKGDTQKYLHFQYNRVAAGIEYTTWHKIVLSCLVVSDFHIVLPDCDFTIRPQLLLHLQIISISWQMRN